MLKVVPRLKNLDIIRMYLGYEEVFLLDFVGLHSSGAEGPPPRNMENDSAVEHFDRLPYCRHCA